MEYKIDRSNWDSGTWNNEPDYKEFEYRGIKAEIKRASLGHLCGYAWIPEDHPMVQHKDCCNIDIDVHAGITFRQYDNTGKCFVIGFDCAHAGDFIPGMTVYRKLDPDNPYVKRMLMQMEKSETYKDMKFVEQEIIRMIDQIIGND